ncbi:MAG: galactokinase [Clostridia bacterium]|nr:galactokinase [Clostridia bacterium]
MLTSQWKQRFASGAMNRTLNLLYPGEANPEARYLQILDEFLERYGDMETVLFSVPGRTEISGNHTDHNCGKVLAASVNLDIIAAAAKTDDGVIRVKSARYPEDVVDIRALNPDAVRKGSSRALLSGMCEAFEKAGLKSGGFRACTASSVLSGSGLSSSAAFEIMAGRILSYFHNGDAVKPMDLAKAGQYAENVYFGKPCGLMDQAACASGGFLFLDFKDPGSPVAEKLRFDPEEAGYAFCIVNTGGSHSDLTEDYAAVPKEMRDCAALMGKKTLRECEEDEFLKRIRALRAAAGDRAVLRAIHYFEENKRVERQKEALEAGDTEAFLRLVSESGRSSFEYLQNVYAPKAPEEQGISLALALSDLFGAVCRVHGGGFAGTIQAYVPLGRSEDYRAAMDAVFGQGACMILRIRPCGSVVLSEDGVKEA